MNRLIITLILLLLFVSCKHGELTFEDLQKAKWDSLERGVYYISLEDQKEIETDSLELQLKGIAGKDFSAFGMSFEEIPDFLQESISPILKQKLSRSKSGYLKINFTEMLSPDQLKGTLYVADDYSRSVFTDSDSSVLRTIDGISNFTFMSKDEAKKKYLADGNSDWSKVLKENPLPNSIEVTLDKKEWTEISLNELKEKILDKLKSVSQVSLPFDLVKRSSNYLFVAYSRK